MEDRIEKRIELAAPVSRVWRALTDSREFGTWFRVKLEGPFVVGQRLRGQVTHPGFEHIVWEATIEKMEHERVFAFRWPHPKAHDKEHYSSDYTGQPTTLVEFRLEPTPKGTLLVLTESGFGQMPEDRRLSAFRGNEGGWTQQMENIRAYVERPA
jgi:uncharacterized protein YndB with AHSA1/START domain